MFWCEVCFYQESSVNQDFHLNDDNKYLHVLSMLPYDFDVPSA